MRNGNFKFTVNLVALLDQTFQLVDEVAPVEVIMKQTRSCPPFVSPNIDGKCRPRYYTRSRRQTSRVEDNW